MQWTGNAGTPALLSTVKWVWYHHRLRGCYLKKTPLPQKLTSNFPAAHIQMLSRERFYGLVRQKLSYLATIKKCETFKAKNTILLAKHGGASIMLLGCQGS